MLLSTKKTHCMCKGPKIVSRCSTGIGWVQDDPKVKVKYEAPLHGITDSEVTSFYSNMKLTNMESILRFRG